MSVIKVGTVIDDRYLVTGVLGSGGMGAVYAATELELNRNVAVKLIHQSIATSEGSLSRFRREAEVLSRLSHKHLVGFYRYGVWQGTPYVVLENLQGRSLSRILDEDGPLSPLSALSIAMQVAEALKFVHGNSIVHRDLTPNNIILLEDQVVKILDFGLCGILEGIDAQRLTESGSLIGSVRYMSPEICKGRKADSKTDIYALGIILYEMIAGRVPFDHDNPVGLLYKHIHDPIPSLQDAYPLLPMAAAIDELLQACLAKEPNDRPDAAVLLEKLQDLTSRVPEDGAVRPNLTARQSGWLANSGKKVGLSLLVCAVIGAALCSPRGAAFAVVSPSSFMSSSQSIDYFRKVLVLIDNPYLPDAYKRSLLQGFETQGNDPVVKAYCLARVAGLAASNDDYSYFDSNVAPMQLLCQSKEKLDLAEPRQRQLFEETIRTICTTLKGAKWTPTLETSVDRLVKDFGDYFPATFLEMHRVRLDRTPLSESWKRSGILETLGNAYINRDPLKALDYFKESVRELEAYVAKHPVEGQGAGEGLINREMVFQLNCAMACQAIFAQTGQQHWAREGLMYCASARKLYQPEQMYDAFEFGRAEFSFATLVLREAALYFSLGRSDKGQESLRMFEKKLPALEQLAKGNPFFDKGKIEILKRSAQELRK